MRRSRLERHRRRQLERLGVTRPALHARITALQRASRRFWDAVLPRGRVLAVTVAAMGIRVVVGSVLTFVLAWLATWRHEVRPVLALVALLLWAVAGLHVVGIAASFG